MQNRLAALSLLAIAFAAIVAAPADATAQEPQVRVATAPSVTVDLAVRPQFILNTPLPAMWRLTRFDSAGHQLMRVEMKYLPNPAGQCAQTARPVLRQASLGFPVANRNAHERLSSALRAAAAIGTLASTGRFRSRS